ncbi:hybrid sensor histidine kinase/response regulator [Catenulispora yoronensis]
MTAAAASREDERGAQTQDLIAALEDSKARSEELERLNVELMETNTGVLAVYTELSEELEQTNRGVVALYAELEEKGRLLREASESKTRLWSNVSHELRTPLNSVIGLSRLLLDPDSEPLTAAQQRQVALVASAGSTLLALVDELLDVAKAEAGRMQPNLAPVDLRAVFAQLRGVLAATAPGDGVALRIPDDEDLPGLVTDEAMLIRILRNLLSNGLKFTQHGEVRLGVGRDPAEDRLVFEVRDTGVGVPEDQQAAVFEEFYQVPGPHQRGHTGTGLGLPYARRLAELLGGSLTLESTPGEGTCVTLRLPTAPTAQSAQSAPRRLDVLVTIDDDPGFHDLCRQELAVLADRVVEVCDPRLAVETVARERPGAVLVDLHMPEMDGYAVLAALDSDPALRAVPVVLVTSADPALVDTERLLHATGVLSKSRLTARAVAAALFPESGAAPETGTGPGGERA